jgi:cobalamin biosynthesis Mg chelatase CobN
VFSALCQRKSYEEYAPLHTNRKRNGVLMTTLETLEARYEAAATTTATTAATAAKTVAAAEAAREVAVRKSTSAAAAAAAAVAAAASSAAEAESLRRRCSHAEAEAAEATTNALRDCRSCSVFFYITLFIFCMFFCL